MIAVSRAANSAARREIVQIRSFRNVLYRHCARPRDQPLVGLVLFGWTQPGPASRSASTPDDVVVCPTTVVPERRPRPLRRPRSTTRSATRPGRWDVPLVAILGLAAAVLSAALSLRKLQGTTLPYSLPVALAVLKLPSGALTAILGLLLMTRGVRARAERARHSRARSWPGR